MGFQKNESFRLEKGLYLEERKGAKNYKARCLIDGVYDYYNTGTDDMRRAERLARSWWRGKQRSSQGKPDGGSIWGVAEGFLSSIKKESKQKNHRVKWNRIKTFFDAMDIRDITSKTLNDFKKWREDTGVVNHTLHKDLVTIRQIFRWAALEGHIDSIPSFPSSGTIEKNPRPWFEPHQWTRVKELAKERINRTGISSRTKAQREELYDFIMMMVHSCTRVEELRKVRVRDCVVTYCTPEEQQRRRINSPHYLRMFVDGKRGERWVTTWSGAVTAFERLVARNNLQPDDKLFKEHHRDGFRELLEEANLRFDGKGRRRDFKSLRCTALMLRVLDDPTLNLKILAVNAGTSVDMLDNFYLKPLTGDLYTEQLI